MALFRYFFDEAYARAFVRKGVMRFGSLASYRVIEDGGVRGDPKDGTLHYEPPGGLEITRVADGRKLTGVSFTTAAENMFVYCMSNELSAERAKDFGVFCVEVLDPEALVRRVQARTCAGSKLDYAHAYLGAVEYRPLDQIPAADWALPERVALIKPPEYAGQNETRIVLPLKANTSPSGSFIVVSVGDLESITKLHVFT